MSAATKPKHETAGQHDPVPTLTPQQRQALAAPTAPPPAPAVFLVNVESCDKIDATRVYDAANQCLQTHQRYLSRRQTDDLRQRKTHIDTIANLFRRASLWHAVALTGEDARRAEGLAKLLHAARRHEQFQNDPPADVWTLVAAGVKLLEGVRK